MNGPSPVVHLVERAVAGLAAISLELAILGLVVTVVLAVFRPPSPTTRHLFWVILLLKPTVLVVPRFVDPLWPVAASLPASLPDILRSPHGIVLGLWAGMASVLLARLVAGIIGLASIRYSATGDIAEPLRQALHSAHERLQLRRRVPVALSDRISYPILCGIVRPLIVIPARCNTLDQADAERVILHELAHMRRFDNATLLLLRLVQTLFFFHPVVWLSSRMLRREAELACDDAVVTATGHPVLYADSLLRLVPTPPLQRSTPMNATAIAQSDIALRIRRLLDRQPGTQSRRARLLSALLVVAIAVVGLIPMVATADSDGSSYVEGASAAPMDATEARARLERSLEEKAQSMLDGVIGTGRSLVRISVELSPGADIGAAGSIARMSVAVVFDSSKVVIDPHTREIYEATRTQKEMTRLTALVCAAVGLDQSRGDVVTPSLASFDKTQHIQAREQAVRDTRKDLWGGALRWVVLVLGLVAFSWWLRHRSSDEGLFRDDNSTRAALALSLGLFLSLYAADVWDGGLSLRPIAGILGVFLLIVGASRLSGHLLPGHRDE